MGKKEAKKTNSLMLFSKKFNQQISFNSEKIKFGNKTLMINGLSSELNQTLTFLYKYKKLSPHFYQLNPNDFSEKTISITPIQAHALILKSLRPQSILQIRLKEIDQFISGLKENKSLFDSLPTQNRRNVQLKEKIEWITKTIFQKRNQIQTNLRQCQEENRTQYKNEKIFQYLKKKIFKIEKDLFVSCIVMIIQCQKKKLFDLDQTKCIVVFQQCFPQKIFQKDYLIQKIGYNRYNQKVTNFYEYSTKYFKNSIIKNTNFIVCHRCMELISVQQRRQVIQCKKDIESGMISSQIFNDPNLFYHRLIKLNFNNQPQIQVDFGYNYYYRALDNIVRFKCNRYMCLKCFHDKKQKTDVCICQFCLGICECQKCRSFKLLVRFLAIFRHFGGNIYELQTKFLFKYSQIQKEKHFIRFGKQQKFSYLEQMKAFYDRLTKINQLGQIKKVEQSNQIKLRGSLPLKKTYDQIAFYKAENFEKQKTKGKNLDVNAQIQLEFPFNNIFHSDTKNLSQKGSFLVSKLQKKRQMLQKRQKKHYNYNQMRQQLFKYMSNQELKQAINKDIVTLLAKLSKQKIIQNDPFVEVKKKQSSVFSIRPKTEDQASFDKFLKQKQNIQKLRIAFPYNMLKKQHFKSGLVNSQKKDSQKILQNQILQNQKAVQIKQQYQLTSQKMNKDSSKIQVIQIFSSESQSQQEENEYSDSNNSSSQSSSQSSDQSSNSDDSFIQVRQN